MNNARHDHDLIRELLERKPRLPYTTIAKMVGCNKRTVERIRYGMPDYEPMHRRRDRIPEDLLAKARTMLEDRAGYRQTAITLGLDESHLRNVIPGFALTNEECRERALMTKRFNGLSSTL